MLCERLTDDAGSDGPILQRRRVAEERDEARSHEFDPLDQREERRDVLSLQIDDNASRRDAIHHQAVSETARRFSQDAFADDAALRMHQCEGRVVTDGADIAEMIGEPFEFSHQRAQICRARRNIDVERRFDRLRKGEAIGDRAVAGHARRETRGALDRGADHQLIDALVHEAKPLLKPHDGFAIGREAEMARLDNAGVHGSDRYLVERFAFCGKERVAVTGGVDLFGVAARMTHAPAAMIEPGPLVGRVFGSQAIKIADRALEPQRRRMQSPDGWKGALGAVQRDDAQARLPLFEHRHVNARRFAPEAEEFALALRKTFGESEPTSSVDDLTRPGQARRRRRLGRYLFAGEVHLFILRTQPKSRATFWNQVTT